MDEIRRTQLSQDLQGLGAGVNGSIDLILLD
jgi:hypothetical protein